MVYTQHHGHAVELAQQAARDGYRFVVAAGGDGTVNEALNGLLSASGANGTGPVLGIVPIGRGNDAAMSMGLSQDLQQACDTILRQQVKPIDIGVAFCDDRAQERFFINCVGMGFDAAVAMAALEKRSTRGFLNYLMAILKTIMTYRGNHLVEMSFGADVVTARYHLITFMNGNRLAGGFQIARAARMDDGRLDLWMLRGVSRPRMLALLPRFLNGTQEGQPDTENRLVERASVTAIDGVMPVQLDGELFCTEAKKIEVEILPKRLLCLVDGAGS